MQIKRQPKPQIATSKIGNLAESTANVITRIGTMFVEAGAEVYRVEQTMTVVGESIPGVLKCVAYVTSTGIMCSVVTKDHMATRISRVEGESRNLTIINAINALSRETVHAHYSAVEIGEKLDAIERLPHYSSAMTIFFGAVGAAGFALFFSGGIWDILFAFVIGVLISWAGDRFTGVGLNNFFVLVIQSFITSSACELVSRYIGLIDVNTVIISVLMLLVPGLTITNALRDTMMGDYLSGLARGTEALVIAAAIAVGAGVGVFFFS